ncbi:hypothetical protein AB4Y42_40810 [Paraburkholderia sp. EG286B]|uniref:hypothetical protein n=1 Tax=Paraburkholderia sp. EG286B TaxID=3237011 RepID=UPI0034D2CDB4
MNGQGDGAFCEALFAACYRRLLQICLIAAFVTPWRGAHAAESRGTLHLLVGLQLALLLLQARLKAGTGARQSSWPVVLLDGSGVELARPALQRVPALKIILASGTDTPPARDAGLCVRLRAQAVFGRAVARSH